MTTQVPSPSIEVADRESVQKLNKDMIRAAATLTDREARYYVDTYYQWQEERIAEDGRIRSMIGEPNENIRWISDQAATLEKEVKKMLAAYSASSPVGRWAESIVGIGPVISAGLLANIDVSTANTAGKLWRFAGLDPTVKWEKGQKRPWNASLKTLCWKAGESFVKVSNNDNDVYGHIYATRKELELARNEAGDFAEQAALGLARMKNKSTDAHKAYAVGKLPPAHIHARAKRYAVKLFLSHWQHVAYEVRFGEPPPKPFAISILNHDNYIPPPNWPIGTHAGLTGDRTTSV